MGVADSQAWAEVPIEAIAHGRAVPLTINGRCVAGNEERYANCEEAIEAGFPVISGLGNVLIIERPCVLVGSGHSALQHLEQIKSRYLIGDEIIAVKGAHDWLVKNGIIPRAAVAMDPQQSRAKCFKRLHRKVLYLCASQMHPDTWEHLRGYQVLVWHSRIESGQEKRPGWDKRVIFPCCVTSGHSAIALLYVLGRRNFELFGFDSSIPEATTWAQRISARLRGRPLKLDGARVPRGRDIAEVRVGEQRFFTTAEMAHQALELQPLLQQLPGVRVNAHGHGYYQALLAEGKAKGWPV